MMMLLLYVKNVMLLIIMKDLFGFVQNAGINLKMKMAIKIL
jgi:hypothetical protein